ncbi:MAG TPA: YkgJ family cysteine cluster protein [Labilithrix sp.]
MRFSREAAAWVRSGGHAVVWEQPKRARLYFQRPETDDDPGAWAVYDFGKSRWELHEGGPFDGLASARVPRSCIWIVERRVERDSEHPGPKRTVAFDCTTCAACCRTNEVFLGERDVKRFRDGGRPDLARAPFARRDADNRLVLTLLPDGRCRQLSAENRCGIYELRPDPCSDFPMGCECCLYAREEELEIYDGVPPE